MKKFINKVLIFTIPAIILIVSVICIDFFKVLKFQDYYSSQKVGINREMVTTSTFNEYRENKKFDSFIFGSSRSQAYKCADWISYLDKDAKPFHYDASGDGTWGISKKVAYIDELGDTIKNALIVIDRSVLRVTHARKGHLFISMPCISKSSNIEYYYTFLKASLEPKFLMANLDYSIFKKHRDYMGYLITKSKFDHTVDSKNCDIYYGWDKEIEADSSGYYSKLIKKGVFYDRPSKDTTACLVTPEEKEQLRVIKNVFEKHKTKYKIVISPVYDQIPMEKAQVELLEQIFGKENIYNFSGANQMSEQISNFYESSHYRPHVANEIMKTIYQK